MVVLGVGPGVASGVHAAMPAERVATATTETHKAWRQRTANPLVVLHGNLATLGGDVKRNYVHPDLKSWWGDGDHLISPRDGSGMRPHAGLEVPRVDGHRY